ncbi:MAG: hypothetical protein GC168_17770 [Candidatus Hydrogenedens sp.]|nr:hypothetical protein [Candidatus Hydrogenedens sp.]
MRYALAITGLLAAPLAGAVEWSGYVAGEARLFPSAPLDDRQHDGNLSLSFQPEAYHEWDDGSSALFVPFLRIDQHDAERTHFDVREAFWRKSWDEWELRLGLRKVYWGVTESQHLVDIINQTDMVESFDGEEKLGQPMINAAWVNDWGTLDFFVLPGFRERTFAGTRGRLRTPLPLDEDAAEYESGAERAHVDYALRYSHYVGNWDFGLSHFYGTSREPRLKPTLDNLQLKLAPYYDLIHQTGVDVQYTNGSWLLKFEGIRRSGQGETYGAITTGLEYTFYQVFKSDADLGVLFEYLYDSRGGNSLDLKTLFDGATLSPFENDIFLGARFSLNDIQSTMLLAGAIIDTGSGAVAFGLEGERRLGENWKLSIEARIFANVPQEDPLTYIRKDDFLQVELAYYF